MHKLIDKMTELFVQSNLEHTISYVGRIMKEFPNTEAMDILPKVNRAFSFKMTSMYVWNIFLLEV